MKKPSLLSRPKVTPLCPNAGRRLCHPPRACPSPPCSRQGYALPKHGEPPCGCRLLLVCWQASNDACRRLFRRRNFFTVALSFSLSGKLTFFGCDCGGIRKASLYKPSPTFTPKKNAIFPGEKLRATVKKRNLPALNKMFTKVSKSWAPVIFEVRL